MREGSWHDNLFGRPLEPTHFSEYAENVSIRHWFRAEQDPCPSTLAQTAFGLLADFRGEHELADQLLTTPITHYVLLASFVIDHVARARGMHDDEGLKAVAIELWTRNFPNETRSGVARTTQELLSWWVTGGTQAAESAIEIS